MSSAAIVTGEPLPAREVRKERGLSLSNFGRAAANLARGAAFLAILLTLVLSRTGMPLYALILALGVGVVALLGLERTRTGFALFVAYMAGFVLFALLRNTADETGIGVKGQYVVDAERRLFGGTLPTKWLQELLYDPSKIGVVAVVCTVVYVSYYFAAHVVALAFWRRNRAEFKRYAIAVLLTVYAGLAVSFLMPTAPPWLASEYSDAPSMTRVVSGVLGWSPEQAGADTAGTNPVAAMPSLHFALTVLVALALWQRPRLRPAAMLYVSAMGFTLVYGAEHYVIDLLVGAAVAIGSWLVATRLVASPTPSLPVERSD
jgi:membrane-associated phospholipid phosphatase